MSQLKKVAAAVSLALAGGMSASGAQAQVSGNVVKIGVMSDMSSLYADIGGPGSVAAARMEAARAFTTRIQLPGTPTMIVAGRWRVLGNSLDDLLANTAALVKNPPR